MKLLLSKDRKLMRVDTDDFTVKLNGRSNEDYKQIFAAFGITLQFEEEDPESVAKELPPVKRRGAKPAPERIVIVDESFLQHEHESQQGERH